jgi:hypothetical protein
MFYFVFLLIFSFFLSAPRTESALVGLGLIDAKENLSNIFSLLKEDYPLTPSDGVLDFSVRGQYYPLETSPEYKHSLAIGILFRFYNQLLSEVSLLCFCVCLGVFCICCSLFVCF